MSCLIPVELLSLVTEAVLVAECALDLIDGGRYDEPQGDPDQGYEHGVMKNNAYPGANPAAFQPVDPGADRRGENDRTEEQRNDEPCLPDQDGRHQYPDDDERPDGHAAREARKIIARLVLRRNQIDPFATCFNRQRTVGTPRGPDRHPRCRLPASGCVSRAVGSRALVGRSRGSRTSGPVPNGRGSRRRRSARPRWSRRRTPRGPLAPCPASRRRSGEHPTTRTFSSGDQYASMSSTGGGNCPRAAAEDVRERLLHRGEQSARLASSSATIDVRRDHRVRLLRAARRAGTRAVDLECRQQRVRREVRRERVRQTEHRGELRAEQARAEDPERHVRARPGIAQHRLSRRGSPRKCLQLQRRPAGTCRRSRVAAKRAHRELVGAGARPRPRSIRPGCSASSVPNCSAITSGEWFGSMIPPAPTRIGAVAAGDVPITTAVAALAIRSALWCSASQNRL